MAYKLLGMAVWKGAKLYLRRVGGVVAVGAGAVAIALHDSHE
jgi:hypothetical protein